MKKLLLLILCTTTLGLVSCKKDTLIQEPSSRTYNFDIQPNQWVLSGDGHSYTYEWNRSDVIDQITVDDEGVLLYLSHPINANSYIAVPFTYNTDAYSYELFNGGIAIDIQSSDFQDRTPIKPTRVIRAKVVVIPSVYYQ